MSTPRYLAMAVLISLLTSAGAMLVVFHLINAQNERAKVEQQKQAAAGRAATCAIIRQQIEVFQETPPTTATGRNADQGWHDLSKLFHC